MISRVLFLFALVATSLWFGGLLTLGAVVAPIVFGTVPMPMAADAMTTVFRRFDGIAMSCATIVLMCEVGLAMVKKPIERPDMLRGLVAMTMSGLAIWEGASLSPRIEALHKAGALRGVGALGAELDAAHKLAEMAGKSQVLLGVALIALYVFTMAPGTGVARGPSAPKQEVASKSLDTEPDSPKTHE